jgi:1,2-phenylacetyl-CoA epoxidase PaaB subunit
MRITLKASEVAAIIGRNPYKPPNEVRDELWKKYWPGTFKGKTKNDKAYEALSASEDAREALNSARAVHTKSSDEAESVFVKAKAKIEADEKLTTTQKAEVTDFIRSQVYTGHGTRSEDKTSDKVENDEGVRLVRDNSFYSLDVCEIDGNAFQVVGKIDRIEEKPDGSKTLVEIKNRTKRFFSVVPDYEYIQIQTYLQMLNLEKARLVQQFNSEVRSHAIARNDSFWFDEVMPLLDEFCRDLNSSASDE